LRRVQSQPNRNLVGDKLAVAAAARCRRGSSPEPPRSFLGFKSFLGELAHLPHPLPGLDSGEPAPPLVQGPNCVSLLLGEFCVNRGHICELLESTRDSGAKPHLK
jgi:hypothetical protein